MPNLRVISGKAVVKVFTQSGFTVASQRGSHIKLQRESPDGTRQTLTVPNHDELDRGTLRAIYRQALRYIPEDQLRPYFFTE